VTVDPHQAFDGRLRHGGLRRRRGIPLGHPDPHGSDEPGDLRLRAVGAVGGGESLGGRRRCDRDDPVGGSGDHDE